MIWSNLSAQETYRMYGRITKEQMENLLDQSAAYEGIDGIDAHISEAMCQYPAEDFLEGIKTRLNALQKNLRGANREELGGIIEALDDLAQTTFYAADYGRSELNKAEQALLEAKP